MSVEVIQGDCVELMAAMPEASVELARERVAAALVGQAYKDRRRGTRPLFT